MCVNVWIGVFALLVGEKVDRYICVSDTSEEDPLISIGNAGGNSTEFEPTAHCCRLACRVLVQNHPHLFYTNAGTFVAAAFTGTCLLCRNSYHASYFDTSSGEQHFYPLAEACPQYFVITPQTAFEVEYL